MWSTRHTKVQFQNTMAAHTPKKLISTHFTQCETTVAWNLHLETSSFCVHDTYEATTVERARHHEPFLATEEQKQN